MYYRQHYNNKIFHYFKYQYTFLFSPYQNQNTGISATGNDYMPHFKLISFIIILQIKNYEHKTEQIMYTPAIQFKKGKLYIIDQTLLPGRLCYIELQSIEQTCTAINKLKVRGAPALGIVAAYSLYLASRTVKTNKYDLFKKQMDHFAHQLLATRPTAVNLQHAVQRIKKIYEVYADRPISRLRTLLRTEALAIHQQDIIACRRIAEQGLQIVSNPCTILTHCNTGSLATGGWGTALGVIYAAIEKGYTIHVYVPETRPLGQGARLTYWELLHNKIPCTLIVDSSTGFLMQQRKVNLVLFGADRIARNGDVANKIGSYAIAVLARAHKIPCYAVAPSSTFDLTIPGGRYIPIEERDGKEILQFYNYNNNLLPFIDIYNPAFDITPARFLSGIITEKGIIKHPLAIGIKKLFRSK
jgi:methylthioribose-1-phosphate isomerase